MTEEEAEAAEEAIRALRLPPATDEEIARMREVLERAERTQREIAELILRRRAEGHHL